MEMGRPRKATQNSIKLGGAIAAIGILKTGDNGLFLESGESKGGNGLMTNRPDAARQLKAVSTFELTTKSGTKVKIANDESKEAPPAAEEAKETQPAAEETKPAEESKGAQAAEETVKVSDQPAAP